MTDAVSREPAVSVVAQIDPATYGDKYRDHILEIYKLYVASADKISDRRQQANTFFMAINTALLSFLSAVKAFSIGSTDDLIIYIICCAGILLCAIWHRSITAYKTMNSGKFRVIHALERQLPVAVFDLESMELGQGQKGNLHRPFHAIERRVPWIFSCAYGLVMLIKFWPNISLFVATLTTGYCAALTH